MNDERYVPAAGIESLTRFYDLGVRLTMRERRWRPRLIQRIVSEEPRVVVDMGCGTGTLTIPLAEETGARVIGVDGDPKILGHARRKSGANRVEWHEGLADDLPLGDAEADVVVSSLVFHHLPRRTKCAALAEAHRVLRPGGLLLIADWGEPHDRAMRAAFFALQCLDGFENTEDNRRGLLPHLIEEAGFEPPTRTQRLRTVVGTFEVLASRPARL